MKQTNKRTNLHKNRLRFFSLLLWISLSYCSNLCAQVTIGGGTEPQKFSILEILSNKKGGLRLPHLTTKERDAMRNTTEFKAQEHRSSSSTEAGLGLGLLIYNTDINCTEYWNGYKWVSLCQGTANIELHTDSNAPCVNYDPLNPPMSEVEGGDNGCMYFPVGDPHCAAPVGSKAYDTYLVAGSSYASLIISDESQSKFYVSFQDNITNQQRIAVVRVTDNCTGEYKDFIFYQKGGDCTGINTFQITSTGTVLCAGGSVYAYISSGLTSGIKYYWTLNNALEYEGSSVEIRKAGKYKVYAKYIGCGTPVELNITESATNAPSPLTISATNGGVLCGTNSISLIPNTTLPVQWFCDQVPVGTAKTGELSISSASSPSTGKWSAAIKDGNCYSNSSNIIEVFKSSSASLPIPAAKGNGSNLGSALGACSGSTVRFEISNTAAYASYPNTVFEWFIDGVSFGTGPVVFFTTPTTQKSMTISVTATDLSGKYCSSTLSKYYSAISVQTSPQPTINGGDLTATICGTSPAVLTVSGASSKAIKYMWMLEGNIVAETTTPTYSTTVPGEYTVYYNGGCFSPMSNSITVVQSAPLQMSWAVTPTDVIKGAQVSYSVVAVPTGSVPAFEWSHNNTNAVQSIVPIGDGSSASITYKSPAADANVTIAVKSKGHPCGDVSLSQAIKVTSGCQPITSVGISPNSSQTVEEGFSPITLTASPSNVTGTPKYTWYVDNVKVVDSSTSNTYSFASKAGRSTAYQIRVEVKNNCTTTAVSSASVSIKVNPKLSGAEDTSGSYTLTGKYCFDVAQSNFGTTCGTETERRTNNDLVTSANVFRTSNPIYYTFSGTKSFSALQFSVEDNNNLLASYKVNPSNAAQLMIQFDQSVLAKVKGKTRENYLPITISAYYKDATGAAKFVKLLIQVQDCTCGCGAYVSAGVWKNFRCLNEQTTRLNENLDPFVPTQNIMGLYYQWGANTWVANDNGVAYPVSSWRFSDPGAGAWNVTGTGSSEPCPTGYRVPTYDEWIGVFNNNTKTKVGPWTGDGASPAYDSGLMLGRFLFLPASGIIPSVDGRVISIRGKSLNYWASVRNDLPSIPSARLFSVQSSGSGASAVMLMGNASSPISYAMSVRCIQK